MMGLPPPGIKIPDLRLDRDGRWFIEGEQILHARSCLVLTQNIELKDDGTFTTHIGREVAPIRVDDVGFFVQVVNVSSDALTLTLSDGSDEALSTPVLRMTEDGRLYVRVKGDRAWARFLRGPHQVLSEHWQEREQEIGLWLGSRFLPVAMSPLTC
jgi:hypothetical protein